MNKSLMRKIALACGLGLSVHLAAVQPPGGLRIVVIEGENAVNIIQQKTAVAPVVEVRDRNDQPVAGATVRFAIRAGKATFGNAKTVTVTTDSAGRAAVSTLTPTGSGTLQISATAQFQGQTATVTIAQTNVMSAAAAGTGAGAAAGGAGAAGGGAAAGAGTGAGAGAAAGGAGAAAGGGISATTIGIIGGAVAGGAIAAKKLSEDTATIYKASYSGTVNTVFPPSLSFCTRTIAHSGTVQLEMQVESNGTVGGEGSVNGTTQMTSFTGPGICQITTAAQPHGVGAALTGTRDAIAFNTNNPAATPPSTVNYDFKGALNGDAVVGTFTLTANWSDGTLDRGVFSVTLRKQ